MQQDLCQIMDGQLKRLVSAGLTSGKIRADQINVEELQRQAYGAFNDTEIGIMLKNNAAAQRRRARILAVIHKFNICRGDVATLTLILQYMTEHRHARILSGISTYRSQSDLALTHFTEESLTVNLLSFLQVAEEPDIQALESLFAGII
jgi:hypothetical protein